MTQESEIKFRREAVEHTMKPRSSLHLIQITTVWSWIVVTPFIVLITITLLWGFFGSIATWIEGNGIILPKADSLYSAVSLEGGAQVTELLVNPNDKVHQNQVLAHLNPQLLRETFVESEDFLANLKKTYQELQQTSTLEIRDAQEKMENRQKLSKKALIRQQQHLDFLNNNLEKLEKSRSDLILNSRIKSIRDRIQSAVDDIEYNKMQIIQHELSYQDFQDKWQQRLRDFEMSLKTAQHEYDKASQRFQSASTVLAPVSGTIIDVQKTVGDYVNPGEVLAVILDDKEKLEGIFYVDMNDGKKIQPGMKVLLTPSHINREEYGSIEGEVIRISDLPVNQTRMLAILQNKEMISNISPTSSPFEVQVSLTHDTNSPSGIKWTSPNGGRYKISSGMLFRARIKVREQTPASLIIPAFKILLSY